eukprot:scaffold328_cov95-Skeletonema_dohrnii-CCMP3373.AAC.13
MAMQSRYSGAAALLALLISWSIIAPAASSIPRSTASTSNNIASPFESSSEDINNIRRPPWNPSKHINNHGYLKQLFRRIPAEIIGETTTSDNNNNNNCNDDRSLTTPVVIRQVPGDGDCLFHSLAIALSFTENGHLMRLDTQQGLQQLKQSSRKLRRMAVECLSSSCTTNKKRRSTTKRYKRLFIQGSDSMKTSQLLSTASSQYGISPEEYCELMMQDSYWGGGPEIVALCAVLRRPIHVYELVALKDNDDDDGGGQIQQQQQHPYLTMYKDQTSNQFCLRLLATFGSPKFDSKEPLHILSADSRFPDVDPRCALKDGNHFLAMFPVDRMRACLRDCYVNGGCSKERTMSERNQRVRGGGSTAVGTDDGVEMEVDGISDDAAEGLTWLFHGEWYDDLPCDIPVRCDLNNEEEEGGKRSWFDLRKRRKLQNKKEDELTVYRPKSTTRLIGYWINVFVRILAYCGDMI